MGAIELGKCSIKLKFGLRLKVWLIEKGSGRRLQKKAVSGIMLTLLLTSMLTLAFNIQPVKATGTIYIRADGSIDPGIAPISTVNKITYTFTANINDSIAIERDNIVLDGASFTVQGRDPYSTGIILNDRSNVTIKNMIITACFRGISLGKSSNNSIVGNTITNNEYGIYLSGTVISGSPKNSIVGNTITNNHYGIYLYLSFGNSIRGNTITNNTFGIYLYGSDTYSNRIYHNNFIDNSKKVYFEASGYTNFWDDGYPSGGNYWSDYRQRYPNAKEINGSGIWDTSYYIHENNIDRYPLMEPWSAAPTLDTTKPVANAGQDQTVNVSAIVTFDAGGSTDNVGIVSYEWDFGDEATGTGITTSHTYTSPGTYTVILTVKDAAGNADTDSVTITVLPPMGSPVEAFPMWIIGVAVAAIAMATAAIAVFWRRRKQPLKKG